MEVVDLSGYKLAFHKKSSDGSDKCMFYAGQDSKQKMYCVLYELDVGEKAALDAVEGGGAGYSVELY
jgi:gamma-glutamylcyclotransferase